MRDAIPNGDIRNECDGSRTIQFLIGFASIHCEFVHGNQQMGHVAVYRLERAYHVQTPHHKGPGDGDGLEGGG